MSGNGYFRRMFGGGGSKGPFSLLLSSLPARAIHFSFLGFFTEVCVELQQGSQLRIRHCELL